MSLRVVLFYKHLLHAGGAERLVLRELDHLRRLGHDARLLTYRAAPPALFGEDIGADDGLVVLGGGDTLARVRSLAWLRRFRPDWILSSSGHIDAWALARATRTPYALHIHHPLFMSATDRDKYARRYASAFEELCEGNLQAPLFREIGAGLSQLDRLRLEVRAALHHRAVLGARHVLVLSEHARREKRRLYGVEARVLRGALERIEPFRGDREAAREALGVEGPGPLVFTVARLVDSKRIDVLVRALPVLRESHPGATLVVGGTGPDEARLRALAERLGLARAVRFAGHLDEEELGRWHRAADAFASLEGSDFNLTPLEALALGTPALVSRETDLGTELSATGWLEAVEPEPAAAAAGLERLLRRRDGLDHGPLWAGLEPFLWDGYFRKVAALLLEEEGDRPQRPSPGTAPRRSSPASRGVSPETAPPPSGRSSGHLGGIFRG